MFNGKGASPPRLRATSTKGTTRLVLLVLGDEVVHVGLGFGELHLVHALPRVPVEESLPPEHGSELLRDPLEQLLDRGRVPCTTALDQHLCQSTTQLRGTSWLGLQPLPTHSNTLQHSPKPSF